MSVVYPLESERELRQTAGTMQPDDPRSQRIQTLLLMERALLNGEPVDESALLRMPASLVRGSALLSKACGEAHLRSGRLKEGLDLLSRAVKALAAQGQHRYMLDALASLSFVHIRTGNWPEAETIVRFLGGEFARSAAGVSGVVAHALAAGAHLLDEPADPAAYLNAAFDSYAREPDQDGYGVLLLEVWTGLVPQDELPRWELRAAWAQQQIHLGRQWEAHLQCVQAMSRYCAEDWKEAATLLAPFDGVVPTLGQFHSLVVRSYRFLARCRCGSPESMPTEPEFQELDRVLREDHANLALKFHAEILNEEWLRMNADVAGAREARRQAEKICSLSRMPQQARALAGLTARDANLPPVPASLPSRLESAPGAGQAWRFHCFGRMRIARGGVEAGEVAWKRRKSKELLVYLLLQPKYESPRDRVVESLFAGVEPEKAANRLYVVIHELKNAFAERFGVADAIALKEGLVRLNEAMIEYVDMEQYGVLARVGEQLWRQDRELALEMFDQACQLYDELLPEMPYVDWLDPYREALAETQSGMLRRLAAQAAEAGDFGRAHSYLTEWLRLKPMLEEAHYEMIALLANDGRRLEALNGYRKWERICAQELGSMPMQETRKLIERFLP